MGTEKSPSASGSPSPPRQIGPYKILDTLGEGGMGTVYLAEQTAPVKRRVALKLIKLGMDSKAVVTRFEQERQALALMQHDGIAKVYDCGTSERGQPFFVMELVKGVPLTEYCDRNRLSVPQRIELTQQVCDAVQHAHQKGVVHRDLKPGNVLVAEEAGRPRIKIIDFGLAKAMGQKLVEATLFTEAGQVVGTPEYMAPEQADPTNQDIDTRADVYSLGIMLYEVLTGLIPFSQKELRQAGLLEMQRVLKEVEPPRPSSKLSSSTRDSAATIADQRRTTIAVLTKTLRDDLDWLVLKSIEKDRARRYDTADAMRTDLHRYLNHEPLVAGPPSTWYRLRKYARRNRRSLFTLTVVFITGYAGLSTSVAQTWRARAERMKAEAAKRLADEKVHEFDQLAGVVLYDRALTGEQALYPPWPCKAGAMERWLRHEARPLLAMRSDLQESVRGLDARAESLHYGEDAVLRADLASQQFLRDTLTDLLSKLTLFESTVRAVEQRLQWATTVPTLTFAHPNARHTWMAVRAAIASNPNYADRSIALRDEDTIGLVPIGENPATHLWEFYDLRSAWDGTHDPASIVIPKHSANGSITMKAETGIVFVLLPGGALSMGAQSDSTHRPNYDPDAGVDEAPVHEVDVAPFFLARHEITQSQWWRLWTWEVARQDPSRYKSGQMIAGKLIQPTNPVEQVDWTMCDMLLARYGLTLPTEAQWEFACRGGTSTPWHAPRDQLHAVANLASAEATSRTSWACEPWADGYVSHAPVGSYDANALGFHDMHGNVWEWCQDEYSDISHERSNRGGGFDFPAKQARSSNRGHSAATLRYCNLGIRAARTIAH